MRILISLILVYILSIGCANIQSPPGGAGDTTAPSIEYTYPSDKSINYSDDKVTIGFNEYMNRSKVIENLYITPDVPMIYNWSATDLEINFAEPLQPNTTYAINLGTEFTDYYNNSPKSAFSMIFSTGDKLDSGSISGKLSAPTTQGKYVFLYKSIDGEFPNMATEKPDYFVSTGSAGDFKFVALKPGEYRLLAIDDKFQNRIYDDQIDSYGTALKDVTLTEDSILVFGVEVYLGGKNDLTGPKLISANSQYAGLVNLLFDENLDYNTLIKENFKLSVDDKNIPMQGIGINKLTTSEVILTFDKEMAGQELKINVVGLTDSTGNFVQDTASYTNFKVDTTYNNDDFSIVNTNLNDSTQKNISPNFNVFNQNTTFKVKFSKIPDSKSLENSAFLESNGSKTPISLVSNNLLEYFFVSESPILENTDFTLVFETQNVKDLWGNNIQLDTTYRTKFKTKFESKPSSISGVVELASGCEGDIRVTAKNLTDKSEYSQIISDSTWNFSKVTLGKYIFEIFCDENRNGKYDFGQVNPFAYREKYSKSKEYKIDENWEYNDIKLRLDE